VHRLQLDVARLELLERPDTAQLALAAEAEERDRGIEQPVGLQRMDVLRRRDLLGGGQVLLEEEATSSLLGSSTSTTKPAAATSPGSVIAPARLVPVTAEILVDLPALPVGAEEPTDPEEHDSGDGHADPGAQHRPVEPVRGRDRSGTTSC